MTSILGLSVAHDSSICLFKDGQIKYFNKEERLSRVKRDRSPFLCVEQIENSSNIDCVAWSSPEKNDTYRDFFLSYLNKKTNNAKFYDLSQEHHLTHAALSFYNSGFNQAVVIVVDRNGSVIENSCRESESIFYARYPNNFKTLYKNLWAFNNYAHLAVKNLKQNNPDCEIICNSMFGTVKVYETATSLISQNILENGKVMGLSSYGNKFVTENIFNEEGNIKDYLLSHENFGEDFISINKKIHHLKTKEVTKGNYKIYANYAFQVQTETQEKISMLIEKAITATGCKNICLSGGYALNVVSNQYYIKKFPNINFFFEPLSDDSGNSIGAAMLVYRMLTQDKNIYPLKHTFFNGKKHSLENIDGDIVKTEDVAKLICKDKSVAVYKGLAEAGPRALGNRSILFSAYNKNGKDIVNEIKKREWYRPFAAMVLEEDVDKIFEMMGIKNSKFMTINFDIKKEFYEMFPSITHIDKTCRIQTVSDEDKEIYLLLKEIKNITGYGICLNTSFNLAGNPLVETPKDAIEVLNNSKLDYLWFPEINKILN